MRKVIVLIMSCLLVFNLNAQSKRSTKSKSFSTSRSAKTGRYVTRSYAGKHKSTTYTSKKKSK